MLRGHVTLPPESIPDPLLLDVYENSMEVFIKCVVDSGPPTEFVATSAASAEDDGSSGQPSGSTGSAGPAGTVQQRLRDIVAPQYHTPPGAPEAADAFDDRHTERAANAAKAAKGARFFAEGKPVQAFTSTLEEVARNRYVAPERAKKEAAEFEPVKRVAPRVAPVAAPHAPTPDEFDLPTSIWGPRARSCDSKAYYDSVETARRAMRCDWEHAVTERRLGAYIVKRDDGDDDGIDEDGDDESDEVMEVLQVLMKNWDVVFRTYSYYAANDPTKSIFRLNEGQPP